MSVSGMYKMLSKDVGQVEQSSQLGISSHYIDPFTNNADMGMWWDSTSGMSTSGPPVKPSYDPARRWGLISGPSTLDHSGGGSTYVISGHIVGNSSTFVAENIGREGQAKARRKSGRDADRELKALLQRGDKEGMMAVVKAREVAKALSKTKGDCSPKDVGKGKDQKDAKWNAKARKPQAESNLEVEDPPGAQFSTQKNAYNAEVIKQLGFDPTVKPGQRHLNDSALRKKVGPSNNSMVRRLISFASLMRSQRSSPRVKKSHWALGRDRGSVQELLRLRTLLEVSFPEISVTHMMRKLLHRESLLFSSLK